MSTKPLMLEGLAPKPDREFGEGMLHEWRREKERLESEVRVARAQLEEAKAENRKLAQSVKALRHTLGPLHTSLRALFGEIELAVGEEDFQAAPAASPSGPQALSDPRWDSYKQNFPGAPARIIDALLTHSMTIAQLAKFCKMDYDTAKNAVIKLKGVGAVKQAGKGTPVELNR